MADFMMFLLGFIPTLAFGTHAYADYRSTKGKPVGKAFKFFNHSLSVLVVLELIALALVFATKK